MSRIITSVLFALATVTFFLISSPFAAASDYGERPGDETLIIPTLELSPSPERQAYCTLHNVDGSDGHHGALQFNLNEWGPYPCEQSFIDGLRAKCNEKDVSGQGDLDVRSRLKYGGFCTITFKMKNPTHLAEVINECFKAEELDDVECIFT